MVVFSANQRHEHPGSKSQAPTTSFAVKPYPYFLYRCSYTLTGRNVPEAVLDFVTPLRCCDCGPDYTLICRPCDGRSLRTVKLHSYLADVMQIMVTVDFLAACPLHLASAATSCQRNEAGCDDFQRRARPRSCGRTATALSCVFVIGLDVPLVARKLDIDRSIWVGEAYVDGIVDVELLVSGDVDVQADLFALTRRILANHGTG